MVSVTQRIKQIDQPRGGYINPKMLHEKSFNDGKTLGEESVAANTIGMVVDYLSRAQITGNIEEAFSISLEGARIVNQEDKAKEILANIKGLDDDSIRNACDLVAYDSAKRAGPMAFMNSENKVADAQTCENIRILTERTVTFLKDAGITDTHPVFPGAYTPTINSGDGDYIGNGVIWDLKVTKSAPTKDHTLQLAIYYLMGKRCIMPWADSLNGVGIFNPRLNIAFTLDMSEISPEILKAIEKEVIGYE